MFKTDYKREAFYLMFKQNCIFKPKCTIDIERMKVNVTAINKNMKGTNIEYFKLSEMISENCYKRIFDNEVVSNELIGVVGCMNDRIEIKYLNFAFHKEKVGLLTVVIDILSILIMYYMFRKIKEINKEYLNIIDKNVIKIKDFSFAIKSLHTNMIL